MATEQEADVIAQRLVALTNMPEWSEVMAIIHSEFEANYRKMMVGEEKDVWEGRGGINALERVLTRINGAIKFGQEARQKMWNRLHIKKPG